MPWLIAGTSLGALISADAARRDAERQRDAAHGARRAPRPFTPPPVMGRDNCVNCGAPRSIGPACSYCGTPTAPTRADGGGADVSGGEFVVAARYGHAITRADPFGHANSSDPMGSHQASYESLRNGWEEASRAQGMANAYAYTPPPPPPAPAPADFECGRGGDFAGAGADGSWRDGP